MSRHDNDPKSIIPLNALLIVPKQQDAAELKQFIKKLKLAFKSKIEDVYIVGINKESDPMVTDVEGHYDLDGVSLTGNEKAMEVVVASDAPH